MHQVEKAFDHAGPHYNYYYLSRYVVGVVSPAISVGATMADRELTLKQEKFVSAYLGEANGNAKEAARIAGYKSPHPEGARLLHNATVAARIKESTNRYAGTAEEVLGKLYDIATADWREFVEVLRYDRNGNPIKVKMDLTNQVRALELLGKYHQLFVEKHQLDVNVREHRVGVPQSALDAMFRVADATADDELNA